MSRFILSRMVALNRSMAATTTTRLVKMTLMPGSAVARQTFTPLRLFASWGVEKPPIDRKEIELRIIKSVSSHDKVEIDKVKIESHLMNDLGLDSLDQVEVIVAVEDEFGIMIEDVDAEKLFTVNDIVDQVIKSLDVVDPRQNPGHTHPKTMDFGGSKE